MFSLDNIDEPLWYTSLPAISSYHNFPFDRETCRWTLYATLSIGEKTMEKWHGWHLKLQTSKRGEFYWPFLVSLFPFQQMLGRVSSHGVESHRGNALNICCAWIKSWLKRHQTDPVFLFMFFFCLQYRVTLWQSYCGEHHWTRNHDWGSS